MTLAKYFLNTVGVLHLGSLADWAWLYFWDYSIGSIAPGKWNLVQLKWYTIYLTQVFIDTYTV
jgi:hypothetical protein